MQEKQEIPEFVQGIATKKSAAEQRREIVKKEYAKLLDKLGKKNGANQKFIHNDFLDVDVWFINREGGKEATKNSVHNWQSTYALLHLETVVEKAKAKEGLPIYSPAKQTGNQARFQYVNMATLYYEFVDTEKDYLNFTAKLMLGIKNEGTHIQYSLTKIDVK
jgi:hypothetical protein